MPIVALPTSRPKLERSFLFSVYLTLGLACVCLTYAEYNLLPEIVFLAGVVEILLVVAFLAEGKWSLTNRTANLFGGVVAVVAGSWMVYQTMRPTSGVLQSI